MQFSQNIDGFRQITKRFTGLLELIQLYNKQNPLQKIFICTIYQNYTLALIKKIANFCGTNYSGKFHSDLSVPVHSRNSLWSQINLDAFVWVHTCSS